MKKIAGLFLILCFFVSMMGCNSESENKNNPDNTITDNTNVTITENPTQEPTPEPTPTESIDTPPLTEEEIHILKLNKRLHAKDYWIEDNAILCAEVKCEAIILSDDEEKQYPELAKILLKQEAGFKKNIIGEEYDSLVELANEQISAGKISSTHLQSIYDRQVRRADSTVLSILVDSYYFNGVFDARSLWGENYDTQTGKELLFSEVVTDVDGFTQVVKNQLIHYAGANIFTRDDIIEEYFEMYGVDGTHWTLDYNGVTVYFSEGEIADSGFGAMNVTVTFAEHPELFAERYMKIPETYTVALPVKSTFFTDMDGDDICEELTVVDSYSYNEEYPFYANVCINTDFDYHEEDFYAYFFKPYYVKTADDKHYLYLFAQQDFHMYLYVYDITYGTVKKVGEANVAPFYSQDMYAVPTNPDCMHFDIYSDEAELSYVPEGNDFFSISIDGMPAQG